MCQKVLTIWDTLCPIWAQCVQVCKHHASLAGPKGYPASPPRARAVALESSSRERGGEGRLRLESSSCDRILRNRVRAVGLDHFGSSSSRRILRNSTSTSTPRIRPLYPLVTKVTLRGLRGANSIGFPPNSGGGRLVLGFTLPAT